MNIRKDAQLCAAGTPDAQMLEKINRYTKSPLVAQQVYAFSVRLCDDVTDRDFERFDTAALPILAELFCGKTGIMDHEWSADRQIARIFDAEVCSQDGVSFVRAQCYLLRTSKNEELIAQIEGGILKEVSIGCAVGSCRCSICGKEYGTCGHRKGEHYDEEVCVAILQDPTDAYEFSFVAVPAQRSAGVLKAMKGGESVEDLIRKHPDIAEELKSLQQQAQFGKECREALVDEVVSLGVLLDFGADEALLRKSFAQLSFSELSSLRSAMASKSAQLFPSATQLPSAAPYSGSLEAEYII